MGWFYTEYVCGTQLASYRMNATFDRGRQGAGGRAQDVGLSMKMTRSTGSDNFPDAGAVDLELPGGRSSWEALSLQATAGSMRRFPARV